MKSIKPGRGPSMMGGIMAIAIAVFGILWTIGAGSITGEFSGTSFEGDFMVSGMDIVTDSDFGMMSGFGSDPFDTMGTIFPLFGVVFVIIAVCIAVYNFKNATSKNRYSEYDIVDGTEEPDPLNERFGNACENSFEEGGSFSDSDLFCPYCGTPAEGDYLYCKKCGKRLPRE